MENEKMKKVEKSKNTVTISLPRISSIKAENLLLVLLIVVGLLQTVQLFGLKTVSAKTSIAPKTTSTTSTSAPDSGSQLPEMVGGC